MVRKRTEEKQKNAGQDAESLHRSDSPVDMNTQHIERAAFLPENDGHRPHENHDSREDFGSDVDIRETGGSCFI